MDNFVSLFEARVFIVRSFCKLEPVAVFFVLLRVGLELTAEGGKTCIQCRVFRKFSPSSEITYVLYALAN